MPRRTGSQPTRFAEVPFWVVIGLSLCLLGTLVFSLSGFWRGMVIGAVVGFNGGAVLHGLLRSGVTPATRKSQLLR